MLLSEAELIKYHSFLNLHLTGKMKFLNQNYNYFLCTLLFCNNLSNLYNELNKSLLMIGFVNLSNVLVYVFSLDQKRIATIRYRNYTSEEVLSSEKHNFNLI